MELPRDEAGRTRKVRACGLAGVRRVAVLGFGKGRIEELPGRQEIFFGMIEMYSLLISCRVMIRPVTRALAEQTSIFVGHGWGRPIPPGRRSRRES